MQTELREIQLHLRSHDLKFKEIEEHLKRHDERFEKIDQRFEKIDQRFEKIDQRFEEIDQRFVGIEQKLGAIGVQLENLQSVVQLLAEQMSEFNRSTREVRGRLNVVEDHQQLMEIRVRLLEKSPPN